MNIKQVFLGIVLSLVIVCGAFADRQLSREEILNIFGHLTSQPRKTWIDAGVIEAEHQEYKAPITTDEKEINNQISQEIQAFQVSASQSLLTEDLEKMKLDAIPFNVRYRLANEYSMETSVIVKYDGKRFYWEIDVDSRSDSVNVPSDLEGNQMTKEFDLNANSKRVFSWDGQKYSTYCLPVNNSIVDNAGMMPHAVNGPLTAGLVPWGYGYLTYENLAQYESEAIEKLVGSQVQIHLSFNNALGSEFSFVLDPSKDYAVLSSTVIKKNSMNARQLGGFRLIDGDWIPTTIVIEKRDTATNKLLASDFWNITKISTASPSPWEFGIDYDHDTTVEYYYNASKSPTVYQYSSLIDTDLLLAERLAYIASEGTRPQNCATAALQFAALQLGKDVLSPQLEQLVDSSNNMTSLLTMKQFAQSRGFNCKAVKTDLQGLKNLPGGCKAILHFPGKDHYVLLEHIDQEYVWTIDLSEDRFYDRTNINFFGMDWTEGTALLISNQSIILPDKAVEIPDAQMQEIYGGYGFTCTKVFQEYDCIYCMYYDSACQGLFQYFFARMLCERAATGGCLNDKWYPYYASTLCIDDEYQPEVCDVTGVWTWYEMWCCL